MNFNDKILSAIDEARLLGLFKSFCEKNESVSSKQRLRNIISRAPDKENAVKSIFQNEMDVSLADSEVKRMYCLIKAFLSKSALRKNIHAETKRDLLKKQNYKCKLCGSVIDLNSHTDHIVPFKYVGDELNENLQMLCEHCNKSKNASIDYEVKALLKLV